MYDIYAKPLDYNYDIFLGYIYLDNIEDVINNAIIKLLSPSQEDFIYNRSIVLLYPNSRYFKIIIKDTYDDSKEIYSCIYDVQENKIVEEV